MPKTAKNRKGSLLQILTVVLLLALSVIYAGGVFYYHSHFLRGTVIDQVSVSGMTVQELADQVRNYSLRITERQADGSSLEETIAGKDISLEYSSLEPLEEILKQQNKWLWFLATGDAHETEELVTYDEAALEGELLKLQGFQEDFAVSPVDAHISEYTPENGFQIVPETEGNELDYERTLEAVRAAVDHVDEPCLVVEENKEVVIDKFHLVQSLGDVDLFEFYRLGPDQFPVLLGGGSGSVDARFVERRLTDLLAQLGAVLAYLPLYLGQSKIDVVVHIVGYDFGADHVAAAEEDRDLHRVIVLDLSHRDLGDGVVFEISGKLFHFLLDDLSEPVADLVIACIEFYTHIFLLSPAWNVWIGLKLFFTTL